MIIEATLDGPVHGASARTMARAQSIQILKAQAIAFWPRPMVVPIPLIIMDPLSAKKNSQILGGFNFWRV